METVLDGASFKNRTRSIKFATKFGSSSVIGVELNQQKIPEPRDQTGNGKLALSMFRSSQKQT
jgi:hypothetical protein